MSRIDTPPPLQALGLSEWSPRFACLGKKICPNRLNFLRPTGVVPEVGTILSGANLPFPPDRYPWATSEQLRANQEYLISLFRPEARDERERQMWELLNQLKAAGERTRAGLSRGAAFF